MNHNTDVKYATLRGFVTTVDALGVELVIDEALRNARKAKLKVLIDEALVNKNKEDFMQLTNEYKKLEAFLSE
ncbi:IDEAL domain-containing protein [Staphylococcus saccharolyticus]|uniref:IDEAL domain-containing protein n=1 Tax=Staphylococcus saccharolyticus TaxID=33028 RepID=UPI00102D95CF|nr:IDEAL domain-containing protein [Staphylococcus saccharolyticus]MBL7572881.1 IDEAL domain-containing protein [Staphylococcus saccharolyticus]MBL7584182.1 IDEAL domain-containing protein [Staphylococcus saccharolyticus]MBL7638499.1 IDEAL domain-containing protein [Staphylococcus saccharolyticus]QRJ68003.1 IDEAL domain-containing protein [Staphylococcus saccharolyticus]TAA93416.1 IDEAL domain protein [Staphylococcus saccharolyticus]